MITIKRYNGLIYRYSEQESVNLQELSAHFRNGKLSKDALFLIDYRRTNLNGYSSIFDGEHLKVGCSECGREIKCIDKDE